MEEEETYKKRAGTTNVGMDYEVLGVANYVLDLVTDQTIQDFRISSNHPDFGAFDDIVIEIQRDSCQEIHAIQLKHKDTGTLTLPQLTSIKGDFSIKKYFDSAQSVRAATTNFILYTNLKFNVGKDKKLYLAGEDFPIAVTKICPNECFRISGNTDYCYKFSVVKDANFVHSDKTLLYDKFFENFFLYTDQENSQGLKLRVSKKFKTCFCGSDVECNEYVRFLREWSSRDGKIEKLSKKSMKIVIALKLFSSCVKSLSFVGNFNIEDTENTRRNILREAIDTFDVSIFGEQSYDEVSKLWIDAKNELTDLKSLNKLRTKFHLNSKYISNISEADSLTLSVLLWLMGQAPLVLTQYASVSKAIELCVGKKFILIGDERVSSFSENISVFNTLSDLKSKTCQYEQLIKSFNCSLQGKTGVSVENLIRGNEEVLAVLKTDDLLRMVRGECRIGEEKEKLPDPYIARRLLKNSVDIKILDNISQDTVVILECVSQTEEFKDRVKKYKIINIGDDLNAEKDKSHTQVSTPSATIYLSKEQCDYNQFSAICNKVRNVKHFHHFKVRDDGNLEWIRSKGDLSDIERFKLSTCYPVPESDMSSSDFQNNINLLNSDPGMGKSELTKSFKINCFSECFTIIVDPNDVHSFLKSTLKSGNYVGAFENFLLNEKYETLSERDRGIFSNFLKRNKVVYVWDALDELSNEHRSIVINLILELSKNCVQWVTSRCNLQNILEKKFNVFAMNLKKFEEGEQKEYVKQRLVGITPVQDVEVIVKKIESSLALVEHKDILGIPLQIFMLTELLRENPKKYSELLNNMFTLTDLYRYFIEEKFNVLYKKAFGVSLNGKLAEKIVQPYTNKVLVEHTNAALRLLFPEAILTKLAVPNKENYEGIHDQDENIGLVTEIKDQIPRFVHNSFAEYLAARYFADNLQHKKIIQEFMFDERYNNVRFFFDLLLAGDSQPHVAILYRNFEYLESCDSGSLRRTDLGGRSVLHLACSWGQRYPELEIKRWGHFSVIDHRAIFKTLRESNEFLATIDCLLEECDTYKPDELYNMTPMEYARKFKCLPAEMRLVMKQDSKNSVEIGHIINMLYYSAYYGYEDEFAFYFKLFEQGLTENKSKMKSIKLRHTLNNIRNTDLETMIHLAAGEGHQTIVELLIKAGADVNLPGEDGQTPLYIASEKGHQTIVELLMKAGADVNLPGEDGQTPLYIASEKGHQTIVELLMKAGAIVNPPDKYGQTPLYTASENGHETIVELLMKAGADVNLPGFRGQTPLYIASKMGHQTIVELLMKAGADVNPPAKYGWPPLYGASANGHQTIVELLMKAGADVNLPDEDGQTPLYIASEKGHQTIVELLMKAGADVNLPGEDGQTPLYIASEKGHQTIVELLMKAGADVYLCDKYGRTPFYIASANGHQTIVELLMKAGADVNLPGEYGQTPLYGASANGHQTIVELLMKAGADANLCDKYGRTPFYIASANGHQTIVELLMKAGADVNLPGFRGQTPLYIASKMGHQTIVELLMKAGADVNPPAKYGWPPLYGASANGHQTIVELLMKAGADVNLPDEDGQTPLYIASEKGHQTIVELLMKAGADVNLPGEDGQTPLYIASEKGHQTIVELLMKAGADVNPPAKYGWPPLYGASANGHQTIVELLMKAGADVNLPDEDGQTPLYIASEKGHQTIVELLMKAGADVNLPGEDGQTPLYIASEKGHQTIVELLMKAGADVYLCDKYGRTPFYIASANGHQTIVELLMKAGADVNLPGEYGQTPLYGASANGHQTIVELLMKAGADANLCDKYGRTPFYIASANGHQTIVELLMKAGADVNLPDKDGRTPLYIASLRRHGIIVKMLCEAGGTECQMQNRPKFAI